MANSEVVKDARTIKHYGRSDNATRLIRRHVPTITCHLCPPEEAR